MALRDILVTLLVFGSIPFILKRPWLGIIVWTWLGFMNPHKQCWGFAREMPFALIIALVTLAALLASKEAKKIPWNRESITLALFVGWMVITTIFAMHPQLAWLQLEKVAKVQLMIFVAMMLITNRYRLQVLVWTIALSLGFYGVKGGIFTIIHGGAHRVYGPAGSFFADNNETGLTLAMTIPFMYYLYRESQHWYLRWGLVGAMLLTGLAAFGTHSRGALLGMCAMGAMLWWKSRQKFLIALLCVAGAASVYMFMPQEWFDRMSTIRTYETESSAQSRFDSWKYAITVASDRIFGGGFGAFAGRSDAHSVYFEVLGEHGFIGLGLFTALGLFTWVSASKVRRVAERTHDMLWMGTLARMTQVSLVAYASAGAFLGLAYFDYAYNLVLIVILCRAILAMRETTRQPAAATAVAVPRRTAATAVLDKQRRPSTP